jgi:tetratricopeptide (TPR) repeat protein
MADFVKAELPDTKNQEQSPLPAGINEKRKYLPSINRFITERLFLKRLPLFTKIAFASFFSGFLLLQIVLQSATFQLKSQEAAALKQERGQIEKEIAYLKSLTPQYKNYRDIYYRIALLEYKVGSFDESKKYVSKVLEIDPNFAEGRVLGEKIGF